MAFDLELPTDSPRGSGAAFHEKTLLCSITSAHLMGTDPSGLVDMEFWELAGGAQTWVEMLGAEVTEEDVRELRKCTYSGRPFGEESFVVEMEERFHRKWRRNAATPKNPVFA